MPSRPSPSVRSSRLLVVALAAAVSAPLAADDGDADPAFSTDGQTAVVITAPAEFGERASAVAALADGSVLVGGYSWGGSGGDFAAIRLDADGALDTDFGMLGISTVDFGSDDNLLRIFVEADGRTLLAGFSAARPVVARLEADGELDGTFGDEGRAVLDTPWPSAQILGVEAGEHRAASGRLFFYGRCRLCPANAAYRPFVLAVTAAGAADAAFDGDGWAVLPMDLGAVSRLGLDLDASGRPLIAVEADGPVAIWRLTTAGVPDPAWGGGDGRVDTTITTGNPFQLLVDPARDRLYLYNVFVIRAVRSDGTLDPAFGDQGFTLLEGWDEGSLVRQFALQGDGKLVGTGSINPNGAGLDDFFLIRLGLDGEPDPSFHGNGVRRIAFDLAAGAVDLGTALTFSGGRPVAVGFATEGDGDERWAVLRTLNALVFADGFERGTTAGWVGF